MSSSTKSLLVRKIIHPLQEFVEAEAFSGILLMAVTVAALAWANSPWGESYINTWNTYFTIAFGEHGLSKPAILWINDGLMAIFFFVVGLEIKREILTGELASFRNAAFPVVAAIGGMLVPAGIYYLLNQNTGSAGGWGIPMATDIAFALGILTLLGNRVPLPLKLFLLAFAIVDDIGAVLVIAIFYTSEVNFLALYIGTLVFGVLLVLNALGVRSIWIYVLLGIILWVAFLKSGVHATIAGILLALTIPARSKTTEQEFITSTDNVLGELHAVHMIKNPDLSEEEEATEEDFQAAVHTIEANCEEALSPLRRLEHSMHPWVAYLIMPVFALSNAGLLIDADLLNEFNNPVVLGIILGLVLGKPIGIILFTWLASVTGLAAKPASISWGQVTGAGLLGGIGFTMSIFIANLAFEDSVYLATAKLGILSASLIAGLLGYLLLVFATKKTPAPKELAHKQP
ncbi:Na+/H+ antiporter NhaA [Pontibacter ruber]|uniref:Na(+)/H(+) antiporter NhaA n=1 Tax=Pontibacter ruber TaxID=1343895 RepID=A0ABW5CR98_9BACT|nr:Na+/H+ antiporter NhaA [Pontibacter ruber]